LKELEVGIHQRLGENLGNTFVNIRSDKENHRNNRFYAITSIP
jgi:hypothetical protein